MREIAAAGVQEVVSSWWGWGSPEDLRLPLVIKEAHAAGLTVAVHLEPYPDRTIATVEADIVHLRALGITRFYVYRPFDICRAQDWAELRDRDRRGPALRADLARRQRAAAAGFDGIYTYDILAFGGDRSARLCAQAHTRRPPACPRSGRATTPRARPATPVEVRAATARPTTRCGSGASSRAPTA